MKIAIDMIFEAKLEYTIWCPANFPGGEISDAYTQKQNANPGAWEVTTGMVAHAMANELEENKFVNMRVGISRTDQV
jgi:hypothetical protein